MKVRVSNVENGSVLIIVLWVAIGLVSLALYFGHAMSSELQASANSVAATEAELAIEGAARYVSNVLAVATPGFMPENLHCTNIAIGNARFWIIGRTNDTSTVPQEPTWGLVDEASKINLNATNVTYAVLTNLPNVTSDIASAIIDWRSATSTNTSMAANYSMVQPAYTSKHAPFNTVDELRLVYGMDLATLYGEDANLNGFLDPNEDDAENLPPTDNHDGLLNPGLLDLVTIYSREPYTDTNGSTRVNITSRTSQTQTALRTLLQQQSIPQNKINSIVQSLTQNPPMTSVLEFYVRNISNISEDDFAAIEPQLTSSTNFVTGLININTASEQVLACIPGITSNNAPAVVSYRESNPNRANSIAWLVHAMTLNATLARQIGPYITSHSYQFTADIAAVGSYGRGYRRVKFVFDTSEGMPKIIYRQDLTHLGWALGPIARQEVASNL